MSWSIEPESTSFVAGKLPSAVLAASKEVGTVDPELWRAKDLTNLDLSGIDLNAVGDEHGDLSSLPLLRDLVLSDNSLGPHWEGGAACFALQQLRSLSLDNNGLDALPAALVSLVSLESLNCRKNNIQALPAALGLLPELRTLIASENPLSTLPASLFDAPRLTSLHFRSCLLSGSLEPAFGQLGSLLELDINGNQLEALNSELASGCTKLKVLDAGGNPLSDKKLLKLASSTQAKPILKHLSNGVSKSKAKAMARAVPRPPPARLWVGITDEHQSLDAESSTAPEQAESKKKKGKKGKKKGGGGGDGDEEAAAAAASPSAAAGGSSSAASKRILVDRAALSVRPHLCAAILHVRVELGCSTATEEDTAPFFFAPEIPLNRDERAQFEV